MNIEYEIIGNTIPFDKSAEMYNRSTYIGPADDGWSEIVKSRRSVLYGTTRTTRI